MCDDDKDADDNGDDDDDDDDDDDSDHTPVDSPDGATQGSSGRAAAQPIVEVPPEDHPSAVSISMRTIPADNDDAWKW